MHRKGYQTEANLLPASSSFQASVLKQAGACGACTAYHLQRAISMLRTLLPFMHMQQEHAPETFRRMRRLLCRRCWLQTATPHAPRQEHAEPELPHCCHQSSWQDESYAGACRL